MKCVNLKSFHKFNDISKYISRLTILINIFKIEDFYKLLKSYLTTYTIHKNLCVLLRLIPNLILLNIIYFSNIKM